MLVMLMVTMQHNGDGSDGGDGWGCPWARRGRDTLRLGTYRKDLPKPLLAQGGPPKDFPKLLLAQESQGLPIMFSTTRQRNCALAGRLKDDQADEDETEHDDDDADDADIDVYEGSDVDDVDGYTYDDSDDNDADGGS
eukprot:8043085-Pyramimonas_sp.AAC.1